MGQAWKTIEKSKLTVRRPPDNENAFYTRSAPPKKRRARVKDAYNFLFWKVGQGRPQASWGGPGARAKYPARAESFFHEISKDKPKTSPIFKITTGNRT